MWQTRIDPELLIPLIENRPLIWDKTLESYKDKNQRAAAWREVCITLKDDFEGMEEEERQNYVKNVVKKWNHIRDSWLRSLKSESASVFVKKYRYHKQMSFLRKIVEPVETSDSVNNTGTNQDTDTENGELENLTTNQSEEIEHDPSYVNESQRHENPTNFARRRRENLASSAKRFKKSNVGPRQKLNVVDQKMMTYLDCQMKTQNASQNEERNLSFFKSLLPTVALLNDDQILQFYAGVISLLQNIKSDNRNQWPNQQQTAFNHTYQSPQRYFTPQNVQSSPSASSMQSSSQIDDLQASPAIEVVMKSEIVDCDSL